MFRDFNLFGDMQQMTVTGAAAQLPTPDPAVVHMPERVVVQALSANTRSIFIKNKSDVAIDGSTGGYELPPGSNIILPITAYQEFYLICNGSQKAQVMFLAG